MNYKKEASSDLFTESQATGGLIYLKQSSKYRLESPDEMVISDGKVVWTYSIGEKQVTKQNLKPGQEFDFLSFLKDIESTYKSGLGVPEKVERFNCQKVILTPKEEGTDFEELTLWVDSKNYLVRKMEMKDLQKSKTTFWFANLRINSRLADSLFDFKIPDKVELIDLTKQR